MITTHARSIQIALIAILLTVPRLLLAIEVQGTVYDDSIHTNHKGLPFVAITIRISGTEKQGTTDRDGHFRIDVPSGDGEAEFALTGYFADPTKKEIKVRDRPITDFNVGLWQPDLSAEYYKGIAVSMLGRVEKSEDRQSALKREWAGLRESGLPPRDVQRVAVGLAETASTLVGIDTINDYAKADPGKLLDFEKQLRVAFNGTQDITALGEWQRINLPQSVARDIVVYSLCQPSVSRQDARRLMERFSENGFNFDGKVHERIDNVRPQ